MKSCLAMIVILILFAGLVGTVGIIFFASSSTEIEQPVEAEETTE